jgi:DNA-binding HxlR family transcriptional regulator
MTAKPRARRAQPAANTMAQITDRDFVIVERLIWAGFLSTGQIARLQLMSRRMVQRRLRALLDHGLVRATLQGAALQRDNVFAVTPKGVELLRGRETYTNAHVLRAGRLPRFSKMAHSLRCRDIFVAFVAAEHAGHVAVADITFEMSLALFGAPGLVADLVVSLAGGTGALAVLVEADRGTETTTVLRTKFRAYLSALGPGRELLVVVEREGRRQTMLGVLDDVGVRAHRHVLLLDELDRGLRPPTFLPYVLPVRAERTAAAPRPLVFAEPAALRATAFRVIDDENL